MMSQMSTEQKLLLAADELQANAKYFSAEELVVKAWSRFPESFGLQGFESKFPDSNKILCRIMGKKGLRAAGWLQKVRQKTYRLTEAGKIAAADLKKNGIKSSNGQAVDFSRPARAILARLMASKALGKIRQSVVDRLAFRDAEEFWNISTRTDAHTLANRLADVESVLLNAEKTISETDKFIELEHGSIQVNLADIADLRKTAEILEKRFRGNLEYIREFRADQRSA